MLVSYSSSAGASQRKVEFVLPLSFQESPRRLISTRTGHHIVREKREERLTIGKLDFYLPKREVFYIKGIFKPEITDLSLSGKFKYLLYNPLSCSHLGCKRMKANMSVIENNATFS